MGLRAKIIFGFVLFFIIFGLRFLCANCQPIESTDLLIEDSRLTPQVWRLMGTTESYSNLPQEDEHIYMDSSPPWPSQEQTIPRRRRLGATRNRKRRPQSFTTELNDLRQHWRGQVEDDTPQYRQDNDGVVLNFDSTGRPYTTTVSNWSDRSKSHIRTLSAPTQQNERIREPLAALEKEQKLSELRSKQRKESISESSIIYTDKSYRKPYSQAKREEQLLQHKAPSQPAEDLKNILKNSGGLSLSEILQQKNLSLDDLLKGKQNALLAIQTTAAPVEVQKTSRRISLSHISTKFPDKSNEQNNTQYTPNNHKFDDTSKESQINEVTSEITPNVHDLATIVTLRDNPPIRRLPISPNKSNSRLSSRVSTTTSASIDNDHQTYTDRSNKWNPTDERLPSKYQNTKKITPINLAQENHEIEKETFYLVSKNSITSTSTNHPIVDISQENRPTNVPNYSRKHLIHKPINKKIETILKPTSYTALSSSESVLKDIQINPKLETIKNFNNNNNQEISIEEKLKQPEINSIEKFTSFDDDFDDDDDDGNKSEKVISIEELFNQSSNVNEKVGKSIETITSRIDKFVESDIIKSVIQNTQNSFSLQNNNNDNNNNDKYEPDVTEINPSLFNDITSDRSVNDRTDLLELIGDRRSGGRLFKVLAQRNMTLAELIEHRKRGSSNLHLSTMLQNKTTKFSLPIRSQISSNYADNLDIVTAFENFPHFNLGNLKSVQPDDIKTDSQGSSYFTSIIDIEPTDEVYKERGSIQNEPIMQAQQQANNHQASINLSSTSLNNRNLNFNQWKTFSLPVSYNSDETNYIDHSSNNAAISSSSGSSKTLDPIIQIEDDVARAHDLLDLELSGHGFKRNAIIIENAQIPMGVRSAIIASSVIVGISLIIFLLIFIICRCRQKRRRKLNYIENYNAIKNRLPIISRQSSTTNCKRTNNSSPIIFPGSKNNKLNTMDPNSPEVQEYLFDAMRKSF